MSLKWKELEIVINSAKTVLNGALVQKIAQSDKQLGNGELFYISGFSPSRGPWTIWLSLFQMSTAVAVLKNKDKFQAAKEPSHFIMILRKHLLGAEIINTTSFPSDRIFALDFNNGMRLLVELIPNRANVLLLQNWNEAERAGVCIASFRKVSLEQGAVYKTFPMPTQANADIREDWKNKSDLNEEIFRNYSERLTETKFSQIKRSYLSALKQAVKKAEQALQKNNGELEQARDAELCNRKGNALLTKLYELGPKLLPRDKKILIDEMEVELDRTKTFAENMDLYFKKSKKYNRAETELEKRKIEISTRLDELRFIQDKVEKTCDEAGLSVLAAEIKSAGIVLQEIGKKKDSAEAKPYLEVVSSDGFTIYCGRNQEENRRVTFQEAKGSDLWLHLKGAPGAHVIVKSQKNKTVPLTTLLEAAQLTLYYSKIRDGKKAEVDYTFRKYVKAIKGTFAEVTYTENKTLYLSAEPAQIKKLLQ